MTFLLATLKELIIPVTLLLIIVLVLFFNKTKG